jgi:anti-anti-sigma factor
MEMLIKRHNEQDFTEISVHGDIKFGNWERMVGEVRQTLDEGASVVMLNWSNVDYFDSSALQGLVTLHRYVKANPGKEVILITPNLDHLRILRVTAFNKLFPIFTGIESALKELTAGMEVT